MISGKDYEKAVLVQNVTQKYLVHMLPPGQVRLVS